MGLFDRLKNKSGKTDDYKLFSDWLDKILEQELPDGIVGFNFNLYEGATGTYDIQLIGSDEFDEDDQDWCCTDYFTTGEDICYIQRTRDIEHWENGLSYITDLIRKYLSEGTHSDILKSVSAVAVGFVDGDLDVIFHNSDTKV